ncbi:hypothetical protein Bbelb_229040 [Branchiostoma belcheri]|nr:hypothetical protein Bbelb_229040 [Branchiostoma belcheri]
MAHLRMTIVVTSCDRSDILTKQRTRPFPVTCQAVSGQRVTFARNELCSLEVLAMGTLSPPAFLKDLPVLISPSTKSWRRWSAFSMALSNFTAPLTPLRVSCLQQISEGRRWLRVASNLTAQQRTGQFPLDVTWQVRCRRASPLKPIMGKWIPPDASASAIFAELTRPYTGRENVPAPIAVGNLPAPSAVGNLPAPIAVRNLPTPIAVGNLPAPSAVGNLPAPSDVGNLPAPSAVGNLPAPIAVGNLPARIAVGNLPAPIAVGNLPAPAPSADEVKPTELRAYVSDPTNTPAW